MEPFSPTANNLPLTQRRRYSQFVVPETRLAQLVPSGLVRMVPSLPVKTSKPLVKAAIPER
jgi:hypothetical protein